MQLFFTILPLLLLMFAAYRGMSVIVAAPVLAILGILLVDAALVPAFFSGIFMESLANFVKLYFPLFLLGAIFGKLMELSGFAKSIAHAIIRIVGEKRSILSIVLVGALLTYGGVSLFVVVFALYPFASELFRKTGIPKRLIPATIALGAFTFTMDALPGSPQIQNIIPTAFFNTNSWAAPWLGVAGGSFIFICGMTYLGWRRRSAKKSGEGYGDNHINEPEDIDPGAYRNPFIAILPLLLVGLCNRLFLELISTHYGRHFDFSMFGVEGLSPLETKKFAGIWAVEGALLVGIAVIVSTSFQRIKIGAGRHINASVAGSLLATLNTASEYGFGAVVGSLPGFKLLNSALSSAIKDPLVNEAVTVNVLSGITGSASGGMSIALGSSADFYLSRAATEGIVPEVLHRVASMASGGMDTLPHNGAIITLLAVTGLTHRQAYKDIFAMTIIKTAAVFVIIGLYYATGIT